MFFFLNIKLYLYVTIFYFLQSSNCVIGKLNLRYDETISFSNILFGSRKPKPSVNVPSPVNFEHRILQPKSIISNNQLSLDLFRKLQRGMEFYSDAYYQITYLKCVTVYYLGTLCSNGMLRGNEMCDIDLQAGCYLFRVDGAFDSDIDHISWNFCSAKGGAQTQLRFCIDVNLKCKGIKLETADELCTDMTTYFSTITLSIAGAFDLSVGSILKYLRDRDRVVLRKTLLNKTSLMQETMLI